MYHRTFKCTSHAAAALTANAAPPLLWCCPLHCCCVHQTSATHQSLLAQHHCIVCSPLVPVVDIPGTYPLGLPMFMGLPHSSVLSIVMAVVASSSVRNSTNEKRPGTQLEECILLGEAVSATEKSTSLQAAASTPLKLATARWCAGCCCVAGRVMSMPKVPHRF